MSKRRRSRRDKGSVRGIIFILATVVVLGGGAAAGVYFKMTQRAVDPLTGCPKDKFDTITTVLVDLTDPVTPVQGAAIKNILLKVRDTVPKFGRLEVYPLESVATKTIDPLFAACSPGTGADVDSKLYGNPELANKNFNLKFAAKLDDVIDNLKKLPQQNNSPIFEGLQSVAVTSLGTPQVSSAKKRVIIISDFIHHTSQHSMYQGVQSFKQFRTSAYYPQIKPQLAGAKVDYFVIARETMRRVQQQPLVDFWFEFTEASNGVVGEWNPAQ
jgi:hypothetical protein